MEKICFAARGLPSGASAPVWISPRGKENRSGHASPPRYARAKISCPDAFGNGKAKEERKTSFSDFCRERGSRESAHARTPKNEIHVRRTIDRSRVHRHYRSASGMETLNSSFRCAR